MRYKTKVGFNVTFRNTDTENHIQHTIKKELFNYKQYLLTLSLRNATRWDVRCAHNCEDFIDNKFTCAVTGFAIKIPKIIKTMLLRGLPIKINCNKLHFSFSSSPFSIDYN